MAQRNLHLCRSSFGERLTEIRVSVLLRTGDSCCMVGVVQWSEHWTVAPGVGGSSPLAHPKNGVRLILTVIVRELSATNQTAPVAQWIEHRPPEPRVGGSNPLRRVAILPGKPMASGIR